MTTMSDELENSLTEMDWLARLRVGGFAGLTETSTSDGGEDSNSRNTSPDEGSPDFVGDNPFCALQARRSLDAKPPFSYTHLITSAILSAPTLRMALSEIYQWIWEHYPYYRTAGPGWKNSIRHNLSLNKNFVKVARNKDDPGKGSYWALEMSPQDLRINGKPRSQSIQQTNQRHAFLKTPVSLMDGNRQMMQTINMIRGGGGGGGGGSDINDNRDVNLDGLSLPPDSSFNADMGESFRIFCRNVLHDFPIGNTDLSSSQFDSLKEGMQLDDLELEMLMECVKTADKSASNPPDRLTLNPDQLAELSASLHQYFSQNSNPVLKTEHLMHDPPLPGLPLNPDALLGLSDCYTRYTNMNVLNANGSGDNISTDFGVSPLYYPISNSDISVQDGHSVYSDSISLVNPYPMHNTTTQSQSYTQLIDDIDEEFNWDRLL